MKVKKVETQKQFQEIHNKEEDLIDKLIASSDLESAEKCLVSLSLAKLMKMMKRLFSIVEQ